MIKQIINGKTAGTVHVSLSSADFAVLAPMLAGISDLYTKSAEGGTVANGIVPNFRRFSVGKKFLDGRRISKAFSLPHCKVTVSEDEMRTQTIGVFDVDYALATKCEYCNSIGNSSKG